jgi:anti-sigma regulatory factor (Ser/Thr protein kinase)
MVDKRVRLLVFVASPSDTREERTSLRTVVEELNLGVADSRGMVLELVSWETHTWPGVGRDAQDVINHQIAVPDVIVGIFWKRLGTPTLRASSGTVEEIENALELRAMGRTIEVLVYFNEAAYSPREHELEQIAGVLQFRRKLIDRGLLIYAYNGPEDFEASVRRHLTQIVRRWPVDDDEAVLRAVENKPAMRQSEETPRLWYDQLTSGHITASIDASLNGETYAFIAAVAQALEAKGFEAKTRDRVSTVLVELLTNVANHTDGAATVKIDVQEEFFKAVRIAVESSGPQFDIYRIIREHASQLDKGEREHGLLRACRLSGEIGSRYNQARNSTSVFCEVYQIRPPESALFRSQMVAPVRYEYGVPRFLWIGKDAYAGTSLGLLRRAGPAVQKLFFAPLESLNSPWLGIEFTGGVFATMDERDPVRIDRSLENYFESMFREKRVLIAALDTNYQVESDAAEWARSHGLEFFDNERSLASRLAEISADPI